MANVLVCVKRAPDSSERILLSADGQSIDARHVGYTISPHEECAVELAVRIAAATGGEATVLTLGPPEAVQHVRDAIAVGCARGVLLEGEADRYGPRDVAAAIAALVHAHQAQGTTYDLVLVGTDAADTGDYQVGVRLAYALGRPVA
ncbi:MAG: electron transfer flavoprotein subunit beta/FixA family protein, partial [Gemmatimonadota bacterium]